MEHQGDLKKGIPGSASGPKPEASESNLEKSAQHKGKKRGSEGPFESNKSSSFVVSIIDEGTLNDTS